MMGRGNGDECLYSVLALILTPDTLLARINVRVLAQMLQP